jgi:hypothetical protein
MSDLEKAFRTIANATEGELREQMNLTSDWTMRDIPWMQEKYWTELIGIIGRDNVKMVSGTRKTIKGDDTEYVRATLFINQQGRENILRYAEEVRT